LLCRRLHLASLAVGLVGIVLGLDLLWSLAVGSTGSVAYGLIDGPAHLATCAIALLAVAAFAGSLLSRRFVAAALVASVVIDIDHIPGYLGSHVLSGSLPRPYTHSVLLVVIFLALGWASSRSDLRQIWLGVAFGVSTHLFRDLATGPGVPVVWPVSDGIAQLPYVVYAAILVFAALPVLAVGRLSARRAAQATAVLLLAMTTVAVLPQRSEAARKDRVSIGAYIPHAGEDPSLIDAFARSLGRPPTILSFYTDWWAPLLNEAQLQAASSHEAVPMVTWEPWTADEESISLWSIANGEEDAYIKAAAREAAAWGEPLLLRFAHEMNGDWYPWGWGVDGNTPAAFKAAWRHVVEVFRAEGATNVRWVWCPYVTNTRLNQLQRFYPGDSFVDWAGLDGFNWGAYRTWQSFKEIFLLSYQRVSRISSRPIMIGEIGVNQAGGNKPRWIARSLRRDLPRYPNVRAIVWFDSADRRADFRVDSSIGALTALRRALSLPYFGASVDQLLSAPAHLRKAAPQAK
jgi:membrane-bound metal-dependent hydrolase YbcI (DUF457 family)